MYATVVAPGGTILLFTGVLASFTISFNNFRSLSPTSDMDLDKAKEKININYNSKKNIP